MKSLIALVLLIASVAFACRCRMPTNEGTFCGSDFVSRIKIIGKEKLTDEFRNIHYTVQHVETFKKPSYSALSADIYTSGSSASCGVDGLVVGQEYLVAGGLGEDDKKLHISSCGQFQDGRDWPTVPDTLKNQLKTGFKCPKTTPSP